MQTMFSTGFRADEIKMQTSEYEKQIDQLQNQCYFLERQLERLLTVNPEMKQVLDKFRDEKLEGEQSQMNQLSNNFVLIKTYEQTMKQYEQELENFKLKTHQFEEEQAILIQKNSDLGQQLYMIK